MKMTPLRGASNFIQLKVDVMHNIPTTDVIVIGAGIVGAACAVHRHWRNVDKPCGLWMLNSVVQRGQVWDIWF